MNRVFLCMWILAVPTCMAIIAVFGYNQVRLCVCASMSESVSASYSHSLLTELTPSLTFCHLSE
jgi:hypothetical protein